MLLEFLENLQDHVPRLVLASGRIGGLLLYMPLIGGFTIPVRVRVGLAVLLTLGTYPAIAHTFGPPGSLDLDLWSLGPRFALEMAVGVAIGFLGHFVLLPVQVGTKLVGQQMGLAFAQLFDPATDTQSDSIGQMLLILAVVAFFSLDGHVQSADAVIRTFGHLELRAFIEEGDVIALALGLLRSSLEYGLRISAPIMALIMLESVAMGFVSKTTPQLNILSLGFPLRIIAGISMLMLGLEVIDAVLVEGVDDVLRTIDEWVLALEAGS